ncbi:MAG: GNAT family N-acetyltransferase [Alphaproteobacteria bacterium]|nr:GNAT family N-acetyltransferase [Alphaproteobacteria bacterium]
MNTILNSKITIRPATLDDVAPMTAVSYKTIREKYPPIIGAETVEGYIASGAVPTYYTERNDHLFIAELDDEIVGAVALMDHEIHLMMVTLDHHRKGIGQALLEHGEARLFAGYDRIELESFRDNAQAVNFYKKHGWSPVSEYPMPDAGIPMVRMEKRRP